MNAKCPRTLGTPDSVCSVVTPCSLEYETNTLRQHKEIFLALGLIKLPFRVQDTAVPY